MNGTERKKTKKKGGGSNTQSEKKSESKRKKKQEGKREQKELLNAMDETNRPPLKPQMLLSTRSKLRKDERLLSFQEYKGRKNAMLQLKK